MTKRFYVAEFFGDQIITNPIDSREEGIELFYEKLANDALLDEFVIVDEMTGEVVFIGSEVCVK